MASAVYGFEWSKNPAGRSALDMALDVELMMRGPLGSNNNQALQHRSLSNELPYAELAASLHTGDLLMLWEQEPSAGKEVRSPSTSDHPPSLLSLAAPPFTPPSLSPLTTQLQQSSLAASHPLCLTDT